MKAKAESVALDDLYLASTCEAAERDGDVGVISGVAVPYNVKGRPTGAPRDVKILPGAATASLIRRARDPERDTMFVAKHDDDYTLARTGKGTLTFTDGPTELRYRAELNLKDPEALVAYEKVRHGDWSAASIGFRVEKHTLDGGVIVASQIDIPHLSLVPKGAYRGATALAAAFAGRDGSGMRFECEGRWYEAVPVDEPDDVECEAEQSAEPEGRSRSYADIRAELRAKRVL